MDTPTTTGQTVTEQLDAALASRARAVGRYGEEASAFLAGMRRMTVEARDLLAGDVVLAAPGLVVRSVDCFGAACIVDFTDGTATAPLPAGGLVAIEREGGAR